MLKLVFEKSLSLTRDGSIKLKDTSTGEEICTREAKSLAEEIESEYW